MLLVVLLRLPAVAMGIRSATLRRVEPAHARTTYVTGVLTRLVENLVAWAGLVWQRAFALLVVAILLDRGLARTGVAEAGPEEG